MAIMQTRNRNRLGLRVDISRVGGTVSSLVGNGVDQLTVSGGNIGDFIHTTPFSFTKTLTGYGKGTRHTTEVFQQRVYNIDAYGILDSAPASVINTYAPSSFLGEATELAKHRMFSKLTSKLNIAVDLLEGGKTISMLRNALKVRTMLRGFLSSIVVPTKVQRRGSRRGLTAYQIRLDYVTSKWLELRYGWMPIFNSIYGAMDELQKTFRTENALCIRSSGAIEKSGSQISGSGSFSAPKIVTTTEGSARCQYIMFFHVPPEATLSNWTSLSPVSIAWELFPLSFVVDWFIGIGKYLEELEAYASYKTRFKFGQVTTSTKLSSVTTIDGVTDAGYTYFLNGSLSGGTGISSIHKKATYYQTTLNRSISGFPFPTPPTLKVNLNSKRLLDAASLIQQIVVSGLRRR